MKILERSAISNKNSNKALQAQKKYKKPGGW
jgi:hypothetical protein